MNGMKPIIFQGEGANCTWIPYGTNGMPDMLQAYSSDYSICQSITRTGTITTTDILDSDGNVATTRAQSAVTTAAIQMGAYDPKIEAIMAGVKVSLKENGAEMLTVAVKTIPSVTPFTLTMEKAKPISAEKMKVEFTDGTTLTLASTAEDVATGTYFYVADTGVFTFAEADKEKDIMMTYWYDGTNVTAIEYENKMKNPTFMFIARGVVYDVDETNGSYMNFIFDRATNNGDITPPAQQADPSGGWTINVKSLTSRTNQKPVTINFEPIVTT